MKHDVHFPSDGSTLAGHLYVPDDLQSGERRPAVVVVSPGSGIKEQTSGRYADELHRRGFVALAFDHRTYGESEGYPRFDENPYAKAEDIKNAVSFLGNRAEVEVDKIGAMGICGGGGYAPYAAATGRRKGNELESSFAYAGPTRLSAGANRGAAAPKGPTRGRGARPA